MDEKQIQEVRQQNEKLLEENTRLFKELRAGQAKTALTEALAGTDLPAAAVQRIKEAAGPLVESFITHGSEQTADEFGTAVKGLVEAERAYLSKIMPNGQVQGLTLPEGDGGDVDAILKEAFEPLVPQGTVAIAVRGRGR